ncbi:calcium-binding protein [Actinoplanes sp. NPDC023801]|uniref:calcium-binding protein n=1 Tax=Actinoplanes sp. NPDC023801 TaxID=3154595 RepID=UPI0033F022AA
MGRFAVSARIGAVLLTTMGVAAVASPAQAATTGVATLPYTGEVRFTAGAKAANRLVITFSGRTVTLDDAVRIKAGKGCKPVKGDTTKVRCVFPSPYDGNGSVSVALGDRGDSVVNRSNLVLKAHGGSGDDSIQGGGRNDLLHGDSGKDRIWGHGGRDNIEGGSGADKLAGGAGIDGISGGTSGDVLYGGDDNDRLDGNSGNDTLHSGAGNDYLNGGTGADTIRGGSGIDYASYWNRREAIFADLDGRTGDDGAKGERDTIAADVEGVEGGLGNDILTGNGGANRIIGGSGGDRLTGGGGNDQLLGAGGKDQLDGGTGDDSLKPDFAETESGDDGPYVFDPIAADVVRGGSGIDTVDYSDRQRNPVTVDLDGRSGDDGRAGEGDSVGADVENVRGTIYGDTLTGSGSANELRGGGGNDVIAGLGGADRLFGDEGDDDLSGQDPAGDQGDHLDGGSQYTSGDLCRAFPLDVVVNCER